MDSQEMSPLKTYRSKIVLIGIGDVELIPEVGEVVLINGYHYKTMEALGGDKFHFRYIGADHDS